MSMNALVTLRISLARVAQALGVDVPLLQIKDLGYAGLHEKACYIERGWNMLAEECQTWAKLLMEEQARYNDLYPKLLAEISEIRAYVEEMEAPDSPTGRSVSHTPPLHELPKDDKTKIKMQDSGLFLVELDFGGIEHRMMQNMAAEAAERAVAASGASTEPKVTLSMETKLSEERRQEIICAIASRMLEDRVASLEAILYGRPALTHMSDSLLIETAFVWGIQV